MRPGGHEHGGDLTLPIALEANTPEELAIAGELIRTGLVVPSAVRLHRA